MLRSLPIAAGVLALAATLSAQVKPVEHFQCYPPLAAIPLSPLNVSLSDQFEKDAPVRVGQARRFCNPTRKIHRNRAFGISDPDQHLTFYATYPQTGPRRIVSIRNQFGPQKIITREPIAVALPTQKIVPNNHAAPVGLSHFRCYAANGREVNDKVGLSDQFVLPVKAHQVFEPVLFCNPAEKIDEKGNQFPIENDRDHLTCYSMTRVDSPVITASIANQFEQNRFTVFPADLLCVPTLKVGFEVLSDDVSGKISTNPRD